MSDLLDRIIKAWLDPADDDASAIQVFRDCYTDPVTVNGASSSAVDLLARARAMHRAFSGLRHTVLQRIDTPEAITFAFLLEGRHTGPLVTPLGIVEPTGRTVRIRTIDVLTVDGGRATNVWMASDELGLLTSLDALTLR